VSDDYTKQLEKQIEEMQQQLSKTQVDLEAANAIIQRNNVQSDDVYTPLDSEQIDGWSLYSIKSAASANYVWFHLKRPLWGLFKNTEENFNFVVACISQSSTSFTTKFYSYPDSKVIESYDDEKKHKLCDSMLNIARQNKFAFIGNHGGGFVALPHGILPGPTRSRSLVAGKIIIKDFV
jgi:hypothetical protein